MSRSKPPSELVLNSKDFDEDEESPRKLPTPTTVSLPSKLPRLRAQVPIDSDVANSNISSSTVMITSPKSQAVSKFVADSGVSPKTAQQAPPLLVSVPLPTKKSGPSEKGTSPSKLRHSGNHSRGLMDSIANKGVASMTGAPPERSATSETNKETPVVLTVSLKPSPTPCSLYDDIASPPLLSLKNSHVALEGPVPTMLSPAKSCGSATSSLCIPRTAVECKSTAPNLNATTSCARDIDKAPEYRASRDIFMDGAGTVPTAISPHSATPAGLETRRSSPALETRKSTTTPSSNGRSPTKGTPEESAASPRVACPVTGVAEECVATPRVTCVVNSAVIENEASPKNDVVVVDGDDTAHTTVRPPFSCDGSNVVDRKRRVDLADQQGIENAVSGDRVSCIVPYIFCRFVFARESFVKRNLSLHRRCVMFKQFSVAHSWSCCVTYPSLDFVYFICFCFVFGSRPMLSATETPTFTKRVRARGQSPLDHQSRERSLARTVSDTCLFFVATVLLL